MLFLYSVLKKLTFQARPANVYVLISGKHTNERLRSYFVSFFWWK